MRHGVARGGPYGRLFPRLARAPALSPTALDALCAHIVEQAAGDNLDVPAGFTYLAQFVDHDLSFDPTPPGRRAAHAVNLRTPRLDLDSLYGNGPGDPVSAKFYAADGLHLKTGTTVAVPPDGPKAGHDLPRVGTGPNKAAKRKALIPDPRNDENLAVAQTHCAMIRFHNRVVDTQLGGVPQS